MLVNIIPEDCAYNGYILKPLVKRMLSECGRPYAKVKVLSLAAKGYAHVKQEIEKSILANFAYADLLLFMPDADGKDRKKEFSRLESIAAERSVTLLCCAAKEEVETWLLSGYANKLDAPWNQVRADSSVKENHFQKILVRWGNPDVAGGGREELMHQTLRNYKGLLQRCPELAELEKRIKAALRNLRSLSD